jgi:hypothetical protein
MNKGTYPRTLPIYKAVFGDKSDGISGIKLGKAKPEIIKLFREGAGPTRIKRHIPNKLHDQVNHNLRLIKLRFIHDLIVHKTKSSEPKLKSVLQGLEIKFVSARDLLQLCGINDCLRTASFLRDHIKRTYMYR